MPINRYEIRNEYSLADPDLYRAADKDDPEALLEGVAMAGLVGVLRQLGDLAEFASEIFHDLHEEVMATAARGHSLTIRLQQLETEVPSFERKFLSQTDHSPFFYNSGVDWHPNLQIEQNLITQGDLPRFVMDSYEECRGPPRLFLLDKFDVAGAGACLKRYTDPSFFKVETSATSADMQRERKIRKPKKKGPRWRIGEAPEGLPMPHAKLHQLFLDEPVANGVNKPGRRGKLRRRLNGFPFDPKTGKSYMEKLWRSPSPEHKMLHKITTRSSLQLPSNDHDDSDHEVREVRSVCPAREVVGRERSPPPQDREENMLKPFTYGANESNEATGEKDITLYGESKAEGSLTSCQSDEIASEIDNYVDAPSTMESEMDTDSELRLKSDFTSYNQRRQLISIENEEHLSPSSDSQSTRDLKISQEGNNSSKKEISSFSSSDSRNTSPEKPQAEEISAEGFQGANIPGTANIDASSYQKGADEAFPVNQLLKPVVAENTCSDKYTHTNDRIDSEQMSSTFTHTSSRHNLVHYGSRRVRKSRLWGPRSDEKVSTPDREEKKMNLIVDSQCSSGVSDSKSRSGDDSPRCSSREYPLNESNGANEPCMSTSDREEKKINLIIDSQCSSGVSDSKSQSGDDSPRCSSREHPLNGSNGANEPCMSANSVKICHGTDSSAATSAQLLHENGYDRKDLNQSESTSSILNMVPNILSPDRVNTAEMISARNSITDTLDGEVLKLHESVPADVHNVDIMMQMAPDGEQLNEKLKIEESNVASEVSEFSDTAHDEDIITPIVSNGEQLNEELKIEESNVVSVVSEFSDTAHNGDIITPIVSDGEQLNEEFKIVESNVVSGVSEFCDTTHNGDIITSIVANGEQLKEELKIEESNVVSDVSEFSYTAYKDIITPTISDGEQLIDGLEIKDSSASDASPAEELLQTSLHNAETLNAEEHFCSGSIDHQINPETLKLLPKEGSTDWPEESVDAHDTEAIPEEETELDETPKLRSPKSCEVVGLQGGEITDDFTPNDFVALENLSHNPENLADQAGDGITPYTEETELEVTDISSSSNLKPVDEVHVQLDESDFQRDQPEAEAMASSMLASRDDAVRECVSLTVDLSEFVEGHRLDAIDKDENSLIENHVDADLVKEENNYLTEHHEQSGLAEELDEREHIKSDLYRDSCRTANDDVPQLEVSHTVPNAHLDSKVFDTIQIRSSLEQSRLDTDQESMQLNNVDSQVCDETSLPTDHDTEEKMLQEKVESSPEETDQDWLSLLPTNDQKMLDHDDPKEANNPALSFNHPPSDSELPGVKYDNNVEYPKDTLSFIIPPSNPFSETNQMNLDELPPLPPLPPVQWRMGKLQHASSTTEEETMMHNKEIFLQQISLPTASTEDVSSSLEEMTDPLSQTVPETSYKEELSHTIPETSYNKEKVEHKTIDAPPEIENKHSQLFMPEEKIEHKTISSSLNIENKHPQLFIPEEKVEHKTIDSPQEIENKHPQIFIPEEKVEHKTIDSPPEIENMHPQLSMPASKAEVITKLAEEDVANESQTKKLPRPRNPLVEDVSVLDKSKLRKVTERVMPEVQKVDERDSILEQIRAKSFNLKPAATSRPTIQGPKTNRNLAAILEKANAIRQAFAGSDDDEEDSWSDS